MAASGSLFAGKKRTGSVLTSAEQDGNEQDVSFLASVFPLFTRLQ